MVERTTASTHLRRLESLPYFAAVQSAAFSEWITVAAKECDDAEHLVRAVDHILREKRLPESPEDISDAIAATRIHKQPEVTPSGEFCGRLVPGWFYLGHDPKTDSTPAQLAGKEPLPPQIMLPSSCNRAWVQRTVWVAVKPARIDEDGNTVRQPYDSPAGAGASQEGSYEAGLVTNV